MATDTETQAYYSTLELVSDDNTAHAPETDLAIVAPERDRTTETAQVGSQNLWVEWMNELMFFIGGLWTRG